jgi:S-adenosylmethionine-diacylglycerol 3-amino-3-carboxypropyl transferase
MGATSRAAAWLGGRLFEVVHGRHIVYNQCWEDPAVDRQALRLTPDDRVLVITSAGCNALDYALVGARVLAVDVNPRQNHLLELKRAGIRALDFESFFALFGEGGSGRAREIYGELRPALDAPAREFWDREIRLFEPAWGRGGSFYYRGTTGLFALAVRRYIDGVARLRDAVEGLLAARTIEAQLGLYRAEVRPRLLGEGFLRLVGSPGVLSLLGVPGPQRQMVHGSIGGFAGFLRDRLDHVMAVALLRENYFWSVYLNGRYERLRCPEYLKPESFARLKGGLVERIATYTGTVTQCLAEQEEPLSAYVLLDHMDWLVREPHLLAAEWDRIFATAGPGARVIFRSGGPDERFLPVPVLRRLVFDRERAERLHRRDRVGTYGSFHIARFAPAG